MNRCVVVTSHLWRSSAADQLNYVAIDCVANRWPAGRRSKQSNTDSFNSLIQFARRRSAGAWQSLSQRRHCWPVMTAVTCPLQDVTHAPDIEWTVTWEQSTADNVWPMLSLTCFMTFCRFYSASAQLVLAMAETSVCPCVRVCLSVSHSHCVNMTQARITKSSLSVPWKTLPSGFERRSRTSHEKGHLDRRR